MRRMKLFCMANGTHGTHGTLGTHGTHGRERANARVWIMGAGTSGAHLMIPGR